ncbi:MAG: glycosyltransferase [Defluviitaleaceae bacterium]|nr:glycosyltransferase [Defluviitaleaceae bacterium]MCL2239565.1 glycosyltransferase [Defluviitaleaceae bacterium]
MPELPCVSVVVPVYNGREHLAQTLDSIANQTLRDIEIICVDDGSTDDSLEILHGVARRDDRFRIISQKNKNAGAARNVGLGVARGEYLSFLDADDLFEPYMLRRMYDEAKEFDADIVVCDSDVFDTETRLLMDAPLSLKTENVSTARAFSAMDYPNVIFAFGFCVCWNKLFRHSFIKKMRIQFQEIKTHNDTFFCLASLATAQKIKIVTEKLVHYRRNITTQLSSRKAHKTGKLNILLAVEAVWEYIHRLEHYEKIRAAFASFALEQSYYALVSLGLEYDAYHRKTIVDFWKSKLGTFNMMNMTNNNYIKLRELEAPGFIRKFYKAPHKAMPYWYTIPKEVDASRNILLYGASNVGVDYYLQLTLSDKASAVTWVDAKSQQLVALGFPVEPVDSIVHAGYDIAVIAVENPKIVAEIKKTLVALGVPQDKIVWPLYNGYYE